MTIARLALGDLPKYDNVPDSLPYSEKWKMKTASRQPIYQAQFELMQKFSALSSLQNRFGVPRASYDSALPEAPARFSLKYDYNHFAGVTIVTPSFDNVHNELEASSKDASVLTTIAHDYVQRFDPEADESFICIAQDGILSRGGFAYGRRSDDINFDQMVDSAGIAGYRIQSQDMYIASAHNSGQGHEDIYTMLAFGMINRLALDRIAPGLIR